MTGTVFDIWLLAVGVLTLYIMIKEGPKDIEDDDDDVIESSYKMTSTKEQLIQRRKALEPKEDD